MEKLCSIFYLYLDTFTCPSFLFIISFLIYISWSKSKQSVIYLLDYACARPPSHLRVTFSAFVEHSNIYYKDNPKASRFQMRILERGGLGEETCLPNGAHYIPPQQTLDLARDEAHSLIFEAVDEALAKVGLKPKDIGILVTNCSS